VYDKLLKPRQSFRITLYIYIYIYIYMCVCVCVYVCVCLCVCLCGSVGWRTAPQAGRWRVWILMGSLVFSIDIVFSAAFLMGIGGRCLGLTNFRLSCAYCLGILSASTYQSAQGLYRHCFTLYLETSRTYIYICKVKVKVNFALEEAAKAQRWSRGIALLFP